MFEAPRSFGDEHPETEEEYVDLRDGEVAERAGADGLQYQNPVRIQNNTPEICPKIRLDRRARYDVRRHLMSEF